MTFELSRRHLFGAASLGTAMALGGAPSILRAASAPAEATLFGPAPGVAQLSRNENPYGPSPKAIEAMMAAASRSCYYSDVGVRVLTEMIAERFNVRPEQVVLGEGSTEVLNAAALALAQDGHILCPDLFWDTTVNYAANQGARVVRVPLKADMSVDLDGMAAAVSPDTKLVQLCNPNNPTGMLVDGATMAAFVSKVGPKATVLVDEAYNELADAPEAASVAHMVSAGANLIVCRTFSKIYGMAGLRVGYAITTPELAAKIRSHIMSFGGNTMGLAAAIASYNDTAFMSASKAQIVEARGIMQEAAKRAGLEVLPSQANFLFVKVADADRLRTAMADRNIMIRGAYGKWTQWSRVSTGRIEDVKRYAAALPELVQA
ncbi:pyridoxal phosphate-dependent aminotransferase [Sphingobium lignivorans]|uniref:Histidinol-phosphate aminotransferase n=1 Tax=Sphingobium lignivorans TaxID=2735886 RepID=A0ABR6ND26_9SPHN|nr:histidinol-phosphate transaminase [Sphingobium lignivorans]MBB5984428.1 histidinol-phosphate aminotransferase [Sphingobium lignivorans]